MVDGGVKTFDAAFLSKIGIDYGANLYLTFENRNTKRQDQFKLEGQLAVALKLATFNLTGNVSVSGSNNETNVEQFKNFVFTLKGDINLEENYPTSHTQVINLIAKFPKLMKKANGGKGAQHTFYLLSVEKLKKWYNANAKPDARKKRQTSQLSKESESESGELIDPLNVTIPWNKIRHHVHAEEAVEALLLLEHLDVVHRNFEEMAQRIYLFREFLDDESLKVLDEERAQILRVRDRMHVNIARNMAEARHGVVLDSTYRASWKLLMTESRQEIQQLEAVFNEKLRELGFKISLIDIVASEQGIWTNRNENYANVVMRETAKQQSSKINAKVCLVRYKKTYSNAVNYKSVRNMKLKKSDPTHIPIMVDCDTTFNEEVTRPCSRNHTGDTFDNKCNPYGTNIPDTFETRESILANTESHGVKQNRVQKDAALPSLFYPRSHPPATFPFQNYSTSSNYRNRKNTHGFRRQHPGSRSRSRKNERQV